MSFYKPPVNHQRQQRIARVKMLTQSVADDVKVLPPSYESLMCNDQKHYDNIKRGVSSIIQTMKLYLNPTIKENCNHFVENIFRRNNFATLMKTLDMTSESTTTMMVCLVVVAIATKFEYNDFFVGYPTYFKKINFGIIMGPGYRRTYYIPRELSDAHVNDCFCRDIIRFEILLMASVDWLPFKPVLEHK